MTPKEIANKLCMRFLIETTTDIPYGINKTIAKECALIAADEILHLTAIKESWFNIKGKYKERLVLDQYWVEVKKEIQKL